MAATYKDIQRVTGLSLSTISKYFNNKNVSHKNREAIQIATEELDFRVNVFAQSLKSRRSKAIGVLIPELYGAFNATIMSEVGHSLRQKGYGILVCDCHSEPEFEPEALEFLLDRQVDGIIIVPFARDTHYLEAIIKRNIPVVVVDRLLEKLRVDTVVLDNWKAGCLAAEELIQNGHAKVGLINGPRWIYSMRERRWGFWRTLQRHGITPNSEYFINVEFSIEEARAATIKLLQKNTPPTALFATNDLLTLGMVIAVQQMGLSVPEDISLVGFDSLMIQQVLGKPLTMLSQPIQELAEHAVQFILDQIDHPSRPQKKRIALVQPILHRGASVRCL